MTLASTHYLASATPRRTGSSPRRPLPRCPRYFRPECDPQAEGCEWAQEAREHRRLRLPGERAARAQQVAHHVRLVLALPSPIECRPVLSCQTRRLEDVLHTERYPTQRSIRRPRPDIHLHPRADFAVRRRDAEHVLTQQRVRRPFARLHQSKIPCDHYIAQSSLKNPASTILPGHR